MDRNRPGGQIFLSYSTVDSEIASKVYKELWANDINLWKFDLRNSIGDVWSSEIDKALHASSGLIAIISPDYMKSKVCVREMNSAIELGLPVYPILIRQLPLSALPDSWSRFQVLDLRQGIYKDGLGTLVLAIKREKIHAPIPRCNVVVRRKRQFSGSANHFVVFCDREQRAVLHNGEECSFAVSPGMHRLQVSFNQYHRRVSSQDVGGYSRGESEVIEVRFEEGSSRYFVCSYPTGWQGFIDGWRPVHRLVFLEVPVRG